MKPLLKWAGGKHRLAPVIARALGRGAGVYAEPFLGSASVYLHLAYVGLVDPARARLSDVNAKLIAFHVAIRDDPRGVLAELERLPSETWREDYLEIRADYNRGPFEGALHAAELLWLNRAGFNGLYRENRAGHFNVPVGRYARLVLPTPDHVFAVSRLLRGAELTAQGFPAALGGLGKGDRAYCDPPYLPRRGEPSSSFTAYAAGGFGESAHRELAAEALAAGARGARVVVSNHDSPAARAIYRGLRFRRLTVSRSIAGDRQPVREILAYTRLSREIASPG